MKKIKVVPSIPVPDINGGPDKKISVSLKDKTLTIKDESSEREIRLQVEGDDLLVFCYHAEKAVPGELTILQDSILFNYEDMPTLKLPEDYEEN